MRPNNLKQIIFVLGTCLFLVLLPGLAQASESAGASSFMHRINLLIFQLSLIIVVTYFGALVFERWKLPGVLGEIIVGVIIGPFALGSIPIFMFPEGLFPMQQEFPVSVELYSLAAIASIILLFFAGLETDLKMFLKYSISGTIIGISGVVFSFVAGDVVGILLAEPVFGRPMGFLDPVPLFLGVMSTATSVGITARILSEKRKLNSPEGVTILSAAVIDDVMGIIILAVIIGAVQHHHVEAKDVALITLKACMMWLGFTGLGLYFAPRISNTLKKIDNRGQIALISFALALLLAGIFEHSGLALIVGAYIAGLSLSRTDLSYVIRETLESLHKFLVPIFFCVMGMLINLKSLASFTTVKYSLIFIVLGILGKLIGCYLPARFLNFNHWGALRVGTGMIPRGEVALIIAGIGLTSGIINDEIFAIAVVMTFVTTLITPPLLSAIFVENKPGLIKEPEADTNVVSIRYDMPNEQTAQLIQEEIIKTFEREEFFVYQLDLPEKIYYIRKDSMAITLSCTQQELCFECTKPDEVYVHTLFFEAMAEFEYFVSNLKEIKDKHKIGAQVLKPVSGANGIAVERISTVISPNAVNCQLGGSTKEEVIQELLKLFERSGQLVAEDLESVAEAVLFRERKHSTGLQDGIAIPHAQTDAVTSLMAAVGIHKDGIDFRSLDGKPCHIFVLILSPLNSNTSYLKFMAEIIGLLSVPQNREQLLAARSNDQLHRLLINGKKSA